MFSLSSWAFASASASASATILRRTSPALTNPYFCPMLLKAMSDCLVVDRVAFVPELSHDAAVAVPAPVLRMHDLDSATLVGVSIRSLAEVVVVRGTGFVAAMMELAQPGL